MLVSGLMFIAEEVRRQAEAELYSEDGVLAEMKESYALLESGAIGEEEFARREQAFLRRLEAIETRRQETKPRPARQGGRARRGRRPSPPIEPAPDGPAAVESR